MNYEVRREGHEYEVTAFPDMGKRRVVARFTDKNEARDYAEARRDA